MKQIKKLLLLLFAISCFTSLPIACGNGHKSKQTAKVNPSHPKETKPIVNVYIENSGSMDGYVKGVTEFEQTVYNYLSDIKISGFTDTLNLYYINSQAIPYASAADANVIADFIDKLEPNTFKQRGGSRGTSDIANVLKSVLNETQSKEIAILVTDGIFSPGRGINAGDYLVNQEIGIKNTMADYLKKFPNTAVIIYQLFSKFNGTYFNNVDSKIPINQQRPYYIWIIGQTKNLASLRGAVPESKFNGKGVAKMFSIVPGNQKIDYCVKANSGDFDRSRDNPKTEIEDLDEDSRTGKVTFAVNADFTSLLLDDNYLTNPKNYVVSNYKLTIKRNDDKLKYTHSLNFTADKVRNGQLSIKLKTTIPKWVDEINDNDGTTAVPGKTYGIKYQISGIYKAFTFKTDYYTEIKINIK
jgi:hypothetical protein